MKKLILTALALAGLTVSGYSQGQVTFGNFSGTAGGLVYSNTLSGTGGSNVLASGSVTLELFYGPAGSTLAQLEAGGTGFGDVVFTYSIFTSAPGKFLDGTPVTTLEPAGSGSADPTLNAELAIAGWTGSYASYSAASGQAPISGITAAFGNPTGGGGTPPSSPATLVDWAAANPLVLTGGITPEPATLAIGGLGAAALLLFRRRK